jgi:hypothetical protein
MGQVGRTRGLALRRHWRVIWQRNMMKGGGLFGVESFELKSLAGRKWAAWSSECRRRPGKPVQICQIEQRTVVCDRRGVELEVVKRRELVDVRDWGTEHLRMTSNQRELYPTWSELTTSRTRRDEMRVSVAHNSYRMLRLYRSRSMYTVTSGYESCTVLASLLD